LRLQLPAADGEVAQGHAFSCRLFLRKLKNELKIPVLALVDSDPYGLKILSVYMKGARHTAHHIAAPRSLAQRHAPAVQCPPVSVHDFRIELPARSADTASIPPSNAVTQKMLICLQAR